MDTAQRRVIVHLNHLVPEPTSKEDRTQRVNCLSKETLLIGGAVAAGIGLLAYAASSSSPIKPTKVIETLTWDATNHNAGLLAGYALKAHGVKHVFTLVGGHISPLLVGAKAVGIKVIDVRHEANAAFAADATSRLTGIPGVVAVTAGPGLTNIITAVKNAQVAQSPMVIFGGATSDLLKGRQSLQDIDQFALFRPHTKWMYHVKKVAEVVPTIMEAFYHAQSGTPGPVFIEFPVDVLYAKHQIEKNTFALVGKGNSVVNKAMGYYLQRYIDGIYAGFESGTVVKFYEPIPPTIPVHSSRQVDQLIAKLKTVKRPMLLLGSQTMLDPKLGDKIVSSVKKLGIPTWLQGMCRGLLNDSPLYIRTQRAQSFAKSDCLIVCGVPFDFRSQYGLSVPFGTFICCVNRNPTDLKLNSDLKLWTSPAISVLGDPARFIIELAERRHLDSSTWSEWAKTLRDLDDKKSTQNESMANQKTPQFINPIRLCLEIDKAISDDSILIGDGGDFVATAAYTVRPRGPFTWLDPGVFGTLGVGAGFAMAAKSAKPSAEVWLLWGDGASGFSLIEFDTLKRHNIPVIAVIGNDASWMQIQREQEVLLKDSVACELAYTDYHLVSRALGCEGIVIDSDDQISGALQQAKKLYSEGHSVIINCKIGKTTFREGSISM